ncbi:helix-turn-helix domain-containing protein [Kibdelosporangium philippinense]|uniref:Helix-turn-helix domain-containing protein n=2 Tax=Kibdelosporangium philippinense TaxID=211113 RepID=A0ABS8ZGG1_9PSEU|nr:helix-turn-helix transcriptional regulator [Kibdelosporangium philippinense]MCE7006916.1 helix-turn-helix domain-containing protein [Kibdelosporangium philippinense]
MTDEPGPAIRRRQLGRQLKELRLAAGFKTMDAAAEATDLSRATISRIESAKQVILPKTVRTLCHAYGIGAPMLDHLVRQAEESDDRGWLLEYAETVPNWFERYAKEEAEALKIWGYEAEFVPGLLQTDEYTRAVTTAARETVTPAALDESVAFRRARQARLDTDTAPELWFVINEAAVRRQVGSPQTMRDQLEHLVVMAQRPNITLQVLAFSAGAHPAMVGAFKLLTFPAESGLGTIYVEVQGGAVYPDRPADFDRYGWVFETLCDLALSPENTISLLTRLTSE